MHPIRMTHRQHIAPSDITGLILAGGRGSRMGGVDKGLQTYRGVPLAQNALQRLQPQVGQCMISANRHLPVYEALGVPVWPDSIDGYAGPLAGLLTGMEHAVTPWLVTVPCDTPEFPLDFVQRLAAEVAAQGAEIAMVSTLEAGELRRQPVFCLLRTDLKDSLVSFLHSGERKFGQWTAQHRAIEVPFAAADAFFNANTKDELQQLQQLHP